MAQKKECASCKIKTVILIFVIAFILNIIWENLHFSLYSSTSLNYDNFFGIVIHSVFGLSLYTSIVDAFWVTVVFMFSICMFTHHLRFKKIHLAFFSLSLILIAILIELRGLRNGLWSYNSLMPTIFGIGLSPMLQLAITGLVTLFIVKKIRKYLLEIKICY